MDKNYLTYNKLVNLYVFFFLIYQWKDNRIDYIKEKYFLIFNSIPNKKIKSSEKFREEYNFWDKRWKDFITKDEKKLVHGMFHMCNGFLTIDELINRYNELFDSYEYINDELQIRRLHKLSQKTVESWIFKNKDRLNNMIRLDKIRKIKNSTKP